MPEPISDCGSKGPCGPSGGQPANGHQFFGAALGPILQDVCAGRLGAISWFRADWQRGGALTGYSTFREGGRDLPVVVKLPVAPVELQWLRRLQSATDVAPRVYATGETLAGYDMAWVVMERLEHGPLGAAWGGQEFELLIEAAGRFYAAGGRAEEDQADRRDWMGIVQLARRSVQEQVLPEAARWKDALKKCERRLPVWLQRWHSRPRRDCCHGDLHLGNAMTRVPPPGGPALLLDFAEVHAGHWVEDAIYLEHLYWGNPQRLRQHKPARDLAHQRKKLGLAVDADWPELANIKRALLAMAAPADLRHRSPRHLTAALQILEAQLR